MKKRFFLPGAFFLLLASLHANAQSVGPSTLNAAGGSGTINGNTYEWSAGEMARISTVTTPSLVVTEGVLQPSQQTERVGNVAAQINGLQVFPNPASTVVNLSYASLAAGKLTYSLTDMGGKLLSRQTVDVAPGTTEASVSLSKLANATYMLQVTCVTGSGREETSYKIEKSN